MASSLSLRRVSILVPAAVSRMLSALVREGIEIDQMRFVSWINLETLGVLLSVLHLHHS